MKPNILLFDIDSTLFDTDKFKKNIVEELAAHFHLEREHFSQFDANYHDKIQTVIGINIKDYTEQVGKEFSLSPEVIFSRIMKNKKLYTESLYPDTVSALITLSKKYTLGIFSQGYRSFQENKLKQSGILPFFKKEYIFIFPDKTLESSLKTIPSDSIIIEDKQRIVHIIKNYIRVIHMNRDRKESEHDSSIRNLADLPLFLCSAFEGNESN